MKTEIFYYSDDQRLKANNLGTLVRAHVYPDAAPILCDVETLENDEDVAWRYIQLLQASISLWGDVEFLKSFPLRAQKWVREGGFYSSRIAAGTSTFAPDELLNFFPCVAIHGRMVLVPKGLAQLIEKKFNIPTGGGVKEIDFDNEVAVSEALKEIGKTLRNEMRRDLRAHTSHGTFDKNNLAKMAEILRTDVGFLRYACESLPIEHTFYDALKCELNQNTIQLGCWSKLTLAVQNSSEIPLSNITVKINGPVKIRPALIQTSILPASTQQIEISLMPEAAGEFPLELIFILPEDEAFTDWLPVRHIWLQCAS